MRQVFTRLTFVDHNPKSTLLNSQEAGSRRHAGDGAVLLSERAGRHHVKFFPLDVYSREWSCV